MTRVSVLQRALTTSMWLTLAVLVFGAPAFARAESNLNEDTTDELELSANSSDQESSEHWTIGAGVAAEPKFQGSDEYKAQPLPLIDVQYGRFFAKTDAGIGVNVIETPGFTAGASVTWMQGYDGDDVPDGIDGADGALGARLFGSARFKGVVATLSATQAVSETDRGLIIDAGLDYPIHATKRLTITPSLGTTWANGKYMDGYFGIDSSEAAASGLGRYEPDSGFKDVSLRLNARYSITESVSALGSVGVSHLFDEAADSPFVEQQTQPTAFIGLTYTF